MKGFKQINNGFDTLHKSLVELVKEHQGELGYINTDPELGNDIIYGVKFDDDFEIGTEQIVYGVRVEEDVRGKDDLQVLMRPWAKTYDNAPTDEELADGEEWESVFSSDVYVIPTLYALGENLEEYID